MHIPTLSYVTLALAGLFTTPLAAQDPVVPAPEWALGTEPVDGAIAGTKRYNVTFHDRSFSLDEFRLAVESGRSADDVERLVARFQGLANAQRNAFRQRIEAMGGRVFLTFWLIDAVSVEIPPARLEEVRAYPGVLMVDPDLPTQPGILVATNASNHATDAVQAAGNRGTGFCVAIVDTGQDANMGGTGRPHRQYFRGGNIANNNTGGIGGSLLLANVAVPGVCGGCQEDTHSHGTGVAGITSGSRWGSAGADDGHANDAFRVGYSICVSSGGCGSSLAVEAAGWQQATADKVRYNIVACNMSYSSTSNMLDVSQQAIDNSALIGNIVACTAAGNSGTSGSSGSAASANGLAVAAATGNSKAIASFSTRGPQGARTFPDIAANGVSTVMPGNNNDNGNYVGSGTSMASPQVCGVATLVKYARPNASAREIKAILLASSENVAGYTENVAGQGYLRTDRAVACAASRNSVITSSIASTTTPNDHTLAVTSGQTVKVAVTWFRHNVASASYSNLGLTVLNGVTTVASKNSSANLYEVVTFTAPITGNLTVRINANTLVQNPQPYSIAACATAGTQPAFAGGPTGQTTIAGGGCLGTGGIPSLHPSGNPAINTSLGFNLTYARPSSTAVLLIGASNTNWAGLPLPANMTAFGAPNCFLRVSGEVIVSTPTGATGTGTFNVGIPNNAGLADAVVFAQYLVLDPPINTLDFVFSNSLRVQIGTR